MNVIFSLICRAWASLCSATRWVYISQLISRLKEGLHVVWHMGQGLRNDCNSQICCICIYLQVMDKEATLEQDMEKEVCLNRNDVIS